MAPPLAMLAAIAAALSSAPAGAQSDPRLQLLPYVPGTVFTLRVAPGYVATVILGDDERIESIAVGNSAAWEVTPSKNGDHLFVKPLASGVSTNVEVVTDMRHYSFLLQSTFDGDPQAAFQLGFDYDASRPQAAPAPATAPPTAGMAVAAAPATVGRYRLSGSPQLRPLSMDDDGVQTRLVFADTASMPAIYAIDDQGNEMLVMARHADNMLVIDRVWRRYIFRLGRATAHALRTTPPAGGGRR